MGIYLFERNVLTDLLTENPDHADFGREIIPDAIAHRRVASFPFTGYWSDIGTIRSFYDANIALAQKQPEFDLYDEDAPIYSNARMLPPAKIQNATIVDSMVGEAAVIVGATVERSIVGIRSFLAEGSVLRDTVMLGADYLPWRDVSKRPGDHPPEHPGVGPRSVVANAIIDKNVQIGADCRIANDAGLDHADGDGWAIRDGIVVLKKDAVIPDGTVI